MARKKKLRVGVLNIKTQPHTSDNYNSLFQTTFESKIAGKVWGTDRGIFGTMRIGKDGDEPILFGNIYKYTDIDPKSNWLDLIERRPLDSDDDSEPKIPVHLKPNLQEIFYIFFPDCHRFVFDRRYISHNRLKKC